ncbi:MAG: D-2-hydroxyacid dehydrogenase, partial [Muribaculaceae bacterium]|nr:D-2-hydroxyacid dehydrogenase [Muribaculaceae bacterium]
MKIVVLDAHAGNPGDLSWDALEALGECHIYPRTPKELIVPRAVEAQIVLTNKVVFDRELIGNLPNLKYIGVIATGYNIVDIDAARERGIVVTNVPAYSTASVAQLTIAHLLNIACQVQHYTQEAHEGVWSRCLDYSYMSTPLVELAGKTLGIVGLGNIGKAVASIAVALGMKVTAYTSKSQEDLPAGITKVADLDTLFATSDVVTLHCPLTPGTRHLVNRERLALMKPTAILLNTSRGPLVDEVELAKALHEGRIAAAGVDVLEQEPPPFDCPLLSAPNCYFTPHIAWATREARERLMDVVVAN